MKRTWFGLGGVLLWRRISTSGTTKARVLPKPVAASTMTSLQLQSKGIVAAWIGMQNSKPAWVRASRIDSESEVEIGEACFCQCTALVGGDGIHGFRELMSFLIVCILEDSFCVFVKIIIIIIIPFSFSSTCACVWLLRKCEKEMRIWIQLVFEKTY